MKKLFTLLAVATAVVAAAVSCTKPEAGGNDSSAMSLDKTSLTLMVGDTYTLKVNNMPEKMTAAFKSSDTKVATVVGKTGKVTAKKEGTCVITATVGTTQLTCNVTVTPAKNVVKTVTIGSDFSLKEGESKQLTAVLGPEGAEDMEAAKATLKWASSDEAVAKVDQTGKVTAQTIEEGATKTASISATVTSDGREVKGTVTVTVTSSTILVTGVKLSETEITLNEGGTRQLSASIDPENATDAANAIKTLKWASADETIATVDQNGLVTAKTVAEGETKQTQVTATVTSKGKEYSASATVIVTSNVVKTSAIQLSQNSLKLNPGETADLTYTLFPANHTDTPTVTWSTSDAAIATVADGHVEAKDYGSAVITAKISDEVSATCTVLVREGPKAGTTIDMSNTYFEYTWPEGLASLEEVTLECWVNIGTSSSEQSFLGTEGVFLIRAQSGQYQAMSGGAGATGSWDGQTEAKVTATAEAGEWHHVAGVYSASEHLIHLYVDGADAGSIEPKISGAIPMNGVEGYTDGTNPNIFMVGNAYGRNRYLSGNIAYARVWKVARTQEQIAANMGKKDPSGTGLIANWYFTEASGDVIKDHSTTGADLTPKEGTINWVSGTLPAVE